MSKKIDCLNCQHYYITWDNTAPRGCKAFNMKSSQMPCNVIKQTSHEDCMKFEPKKKKKKDLDLRSSDLW
jgi:predicted kinase